MRKKIKCQNLDVNVNENGQNFYSTLYHAVPKLYTVESDTFIERCESRTKGLTCRFDHIINDINKRNISRDKPCWMKRRMHLHEFRPNQSPFIPIFLRKVVVNIEADCSDCHNSKTSLLKDSWYECYNTTELELAQARKYLKVPLECRLEEQEMREYLKQIPVRVQIGMLKEFLNLLSEKLFHFNSIVLAEVVSKPLYDYMFRVNPQIKSIITKVVMRLPRTNMETLSFMMIHILHLWEYSMTPQITKASLCDIYGPLLIGFDGKVEVGEERTGKSAESSILMAVMDAIDSRCWNVFGGGNILDTFELLTPFERKRVYIKSRVSAALSHVKVYDYFHCSK